MRVPPTTSRLNLIWSARPRSNPARQKILEKGSPRFSRSAPHGFQASEKALNCRNFASRLELAAFLFGLWSWDFGSVRGSGSQISEFQISGFQILEFQVLGLSRLRVGQVSIN